MSYETWLFADLFLATINSTPLTKSSGELFEKKLVYNNFFECNKLWNFKFIEQL